MSTIPFFSSTELELTGATQSSTSQQDVLTTDDSYLNQMNIKPTTEVDPFEIVTINLFEKTSEESSSTTDETTFSPISDLSSVDYLESTTDYPDSKTATSATGTPMLTSMATSFEMLTLNPTTEFDTNEMYTTNLYEETSEQSGSTANETTFRPISDSSAAEYLESTTSFQDLQTEKNLQTISATGTTVPTPLLTTFEIPTESISHTTSPSQTTSVETNDSTEVFELAIELLTTQTIHDQDFSTTEIANIEEDEFNADKSSVESTVTGESVVLETTLNPLLFKHKSTTELSLLKLKEKYQQNLTPELELTTFVADDKEHTTLGSIALQTETTVAPEEIENFENSIVSENNTQSTDAGSIDTNDDFDVFYKTTTEMSAETLTEKYTSTQTVTDVAVQMTTDTQFNQLVSETSEHESDSSSTDHMMDYLTSTELSDIQPVTSEPRVTTDHSINTQTSSEISSDLSTDTVETTETNSFQDMSTLQSEIVSPESTTVFETNETIEGQTSSNENIYTTNFDQKLLVETTSDVPSTDASTITESSFDLTSQTMPYSLSNSIIYKSTTEFNVNDVKERFKSSTSSMNNIEDNTEIKTPMSLLSTHVTKEKQSSATESSIEESTFSSNTEQTTYTTNKEETSQSKKYSIKYKATTEFSVEKLKEKFQNNLQKENKTSDEQTETSDDKPTTGSPPLNPSIFYQTLMHSGNNTSPNIENLQHQMIQESVSQLLAGFGNFISESPNDGDVNNEIKYEPISEHYSLNESPNILKSQEILPYNAVGYEDPFQNSRKRLDPSAVESDERYDRLKVDSIIDHYIEQYDYDDNYEMSERIASLQNFLEQLDYQDSRFSGSNLTPLQKVGDKFSGPPVQYFNTENKQRTKNNQRFPPQGSAFRMTDTINEATIGLFQASTEPSAKEVNNSSANTEKSDTNTQNSFKLSDPGNSTVSFTNTTNVNSTGELLQILRQVTPHLSHLFHQDKPEVVDSFPILNNDFQSGTFLNDELTDSSEVNFTSGSDSILEKISSIVKHENEKNNVVPDFRNEQVIALNQNEGNAIKQFGTNYQEELDRVSDKFKEELITSLNETKHNNTTDQLQETFENIFGNYDDISDLYDSDTIFETVPIAVEQIIKQNNSSSGNFNITDLNQNAEDAGTFALEPLKETEMLSDGETITRDGSKQPIVTDIQNPISNLPVVVGSSEPYRSRKFDHLCMDPFVVFTCGSCGSLVMCLYGEAFVYNCKYPMMSCHKDPMYNGGVCKMDPDPGCKCDSGEVVKPDPYDYSSYILCDVEPKEFRCEPYEEFNIELNRCVTMPIGPPCTSLGIFPNVKDCRWYQICRWSSMLGNFHQTNVRCSKADYVYSVHYKKCILKEDLPFDDPCIDGIPIYDEQVQVDHFISDGADETVILADGDYIIGDENGTISDNNLTDSTGAGQGTIPANIFDDNDNFVPDLPIVDSVAGEVVESRLSTRNVKLTTSEPKQVETLKCSPAVFLIVYWFPSLADYACTSSE